MATLMIRMPDGERDAVRLAAAFEGALMSAFARQALAERVRETERKRTRHESELAAAKNREE